MNVLLHLEKTPLFSEYPLEPFKISGAAEPQPRIRHDPVYIEDYPDGYPMGTGDQYVNNAHIQWEFRMRDYYPGKVRGHHMTVFPILPIVIF